MSGKVLLMSFNGSTLEAKMSKHKFVIVSNPSIVNEKHEHP